MITKQVSEAGFFVFKARNEQLTFLKKQQWTITNYIAVIYGAIYLTQMAWLKPVAVLACVFGLWQLILIEFHMQQTRNEIDKAINYIFGPYNKSNDTERAQIVGPDNSGTLLRDLPFLLALMLVLIVGALILIFV
jgi:hypothetical protein